MTRLPCRIFSRNSSQHKWAITRARDTSHLGNVSNPTRTPDSNTLFALLGELVTTGVVLLAGCRVTSWSRTQASYALTSCEAELYSMGSAAVDVLGIHAFPVEQGFPKEPPVWYGDSSSALQLANGTGAGRLKHVEVRLLAIQSRVAAGRLRLVKVESAENVADVLTKHVSRDTWEKPCARLSLRATA